MRALVLLADSGQVDAGQKVHALGLGWTVTTTPTPPAAVVVLIYVPWTETNERHHFLLQLVDADGQPVLVPDGPPLRVEGEFEMGRPPGAPQGSELVQPFVLSVQPGLPLIAGQNYEWRLDIDGDLGSRCSATFAVRAH